MRSQVNHRQLHDLLGRLADQFGVDQRREDFGDRRRQGFESLRTRFCLSSRALTGTTSRHFLIASRIQRLSKPEKFSACGWRRLGPKPFGGETNPLSPTGRIGEPIEFRPVVS
jgi:hypothetical protein